MSALLPAALVLLLAQAAPSPAPAAGGPRLFISADMEGIAGVVTQEQLGPTGFDYRDARELMTGEVLAAIQGAREAGAGEIVVADSHGNMQNLLLEKLPADVMVVRGTPRPLSMMDGIDGSFAGVVFVGYHAGTTNAAGVRAHTFSSATLADVRLGGTTVNEGVWNAALAGHFGVPVLAVTGDEAAVEEVADQVGDLEKVVVKWPAAFHAARTLTPQAARQKIQAAVRRAVERRGGRRPYAVKGPLDVELRFKNYRPAEVFSWLPGIARPDAHSVRFRARDMVEATRFVAFALNYQPSLEP
ncbi:MAG TPA: M55 family metallopeptidase [Vicinamibacteria bacterium]|nr:M55 family metallopeptidase [Vicinamibacteria bacterium]